MESHSHTFVYLWCLFYMFCVFIFQTIGGEGLRVLYIEFKYRACSNVYISLDILTKRIEFGSNEYSVVIITVSINLSWTTTIKARELIFLSKLHVRRLLYIELL